MDEILIIFLISLIICFIVLLGIFIWWYLKSKRDRKHQYRNELPLYATSNINSSTILAEGSSQVAGQTQRNKSNTNIRPSTHPQILLPPSQRYGTDYRHTTRDRHTTREGDIRPSYPQTRFKYHGGNNNSRNKRINSKNDNSHASSHIPTIYQNYYMKYLTDAIFEQEEVLTDDLYNIFPKSQPDIEWFLKYQEFMNKIIHSNTMYSQDTDFSYFYNMIMQSYAGGVEWFRIWEEYKRPHTNTTNSQNRVSTIDLQKVFDESQHAFQRFLELQESMFEIIDSDNRVSLDDLPNMFKESLTVDERSPKLQESEKKIIESNAIHKQKKILATDLPNIFEKSSATGERSLKFNESENERIDSNTKYSLDKVLTLDLENEIQESLHATERFQDLQESENKKINSNTTYSHTPSLIPTIHLKYGTKNFTDIIFEQNGIPTIDLHGMTIQEAGAATEGFLELYKSEGSQVVQIITGRGLHSTGGISKIKPAVINYLSSEGFRFTEINKGVALLVFLQGYVERNHHIPPLD